MIEPANRRRRPARRRRLPAWRVWLVGLIVAAVLLVVGIAIGMALHDNPTPDLTVTTTKTLIP